MNTIKISSCSIVHRFVVSALAGSFALGLATRSIAADVRSVTVCAPSDYWPGSRWQRDNCVRKAIADAVTKVNAEALYTVYNQRNKTPLPATLLSQAR